MQRNKTNTILFFKDIESNLIEEAVIVVKGNVKIYDKKSGKETICKNNILKEAELIINSRLEENEIDFLKFKISKLLKKNKYLKIVNIIMIITLIILFFA